jgi:quinoprotein glucose dehydrogenase
LLESLIEPSAKIAKGYETMVIITGTGRLVSGTLVEDDGNKIVVAPPAGGKITIAADDIEEKMLSPISSMPPMGNTFTAVEIADLVAYLKSLTKETREDGTRVNGARVNGARGTE